MNRTIFLLPACVLALSLASAAHGATGQEPSPLAAANCAMDAPPDWHPVDLSKQPGMVAAFGDPDGTRTLMVLTYQRGKPSEAISDLYVTGFDKGMEKSGGKKTAGKFVKVAGFDAYERRGTANVRGRDLSTLALAVPTGDGTYLLEALSAQGEAGTDPEIRQAIRSFHFVRPPGPPHSAPNAAHRAGYATGQTFGSAAFISLIMLLIYRAASKRKPAPVTGFSGPYPYPQGGFQSTANVLPPPLAVPSAPPPLPSSPRGVAPQNLY